MIHKIISTFIEIRTHHSEVAGVLIYSGDYLALLRSKLANQIKAHYHTDAWIALK